MSKLYSNKFVVCLLVDGKPLDSNNKGEIKINFDSEYSIKLINKNNSDAEADCYIDGKFIGNFKIPSCKNIEIKSSKGSNKAFKFVKCSSSEGSEENNNGLIECVFKLEPDVKERLIPYIPPYIPYVPTRPPNYPWIRHRDIYWPDYYTPPYNPDLIWSAGTNTSMNCAGKTVEGSVVNTENFYKYDIDVTIIKAQLIGIDEDESEKIKELKKINKQIDSLMKKKESIKKSLS